MNRQSPSNVKPIVLWLLLCSVMFWLGCGESTKDSMLRVAKQRAYAKEKAEEEEKKKAAEAAAAVPQPAIAEANPSAPPAADQPPAPAAVTATPNPAPAPDPAPAVQPIAPAQPTATTASVAPTVAAPIVTAPTASPIAEPPSRNLLQFDASGRTVASLGDGNNFAVHDVVSKALLRNAFNENLVPTCVAINSKGGVVAVGGNDGSFKAFALASAQGLDRFAQDRLVRRDRDRPLKAHSQSISAIATVDKVIATGDILGEVRLWSSEQSDPVEFTGGKAGLVRVKPFQKGQVLFAISKANKVLFWKDSDLRNQPEEFASLVNRPTVIQAGPGGKGMAIGDDRGRVTFWLPEGGNLKKQNFQPHNSAISGLAFNSAGDALITAARSGEILRWRLPLDNSDTVELSEPPRFVTVSNNGHLISVPSRKSYLDVFSAKEQALSRSLRIPTDRRVTSSSFSNDNRLTAVGDDAGNIYFFGSSDEPFASLSIGDSSIENLNTSAQQESVALTTKSGQIGVVNFPSLEPKYSLGGLSELTTVDAASSMILMVTKTAIQILDTANGSVTRSIKYAGNPVTAAYVDSVLALVATNQGEVLLWRHTAEDATLEFIRTSDKAKSSKPILGLGLTKYGLVWSCDSEGECIATSFGNNSSKSNSVKGQLNQAVFKIKPGPDGKWLTFDELGGLALVESLLKPEAISLLKDESFADAVGSDHSAMVVSNDKHQLVRIDGSGREIERISVDAEQGDIDQFAASDRNAVLLTTKGHTVAIGGYANAFGQSRPVATGNLKQAWLSSDGSQYLVHTSEGTYYRGGTSGTSVRVPLEKDTVPLAISPSGRSLVTVNKDIAECIEIDGERIKPIFSLPSEVQSPTAACFSEDDRAIFTASATGDLHKVMRADPTTGKSLGKVDGKPVEISVNKTQDRLLVRLDSGKVIWLGLDGATTKSLADSGQQSFACAAINGGRCLLGGSDGALYELVDGNSSPSKLIQVGSQAIEQIASDSNSDRCLIVTADKRLHFVKLKEEIWQSLPPLKDFGKGLALQFRGKDAFLMDSTGRLQPIRATHITSLAGPEIHIQKVAVTQDGKWILAVDPRGKLARWSVGPEGFSKPMRCTIESAVSDVKSFPASGRVCLIGPKGLVSYSVGDDRTLSKIALNAEGASIAHVGSDQNAVIQVGTSSRIADFATGGTQAVDIAANHVGFIEDSLQGRRMFVSVDKDGSFGALVPGQATSKKSEAFAIGFKPTTSIVQGELLLAFSNNQAKVTRTDGSTLNEFKQSSGSIATVGVARTGGLMAVIDDSRRISIVEQSKAVRSVLLPLKSAAASIVWNSSGDSLAVVGDQEILLLDANTLKIYATYKAPTAIKTIASWNNENLWCAARDQRLFRTRIPLLQWTDKLPLPPTALEWHVEGREIVFANESGSILSYNGLTGEQINKIETGKSGVRAVCNLPNSNRLAFLTGTSTIITLDVDHRVNNLPISSAIQLTSIASDAMGRYLYACNNSGEILSWDLSKIDVGPKTIPSELRCSFVKTVENGRLAVAGSAQPSMALISSSSSQDVVGRISGVIEDFALLPDDSFAAVVDGTSAVQLFGLANRDTQRMVGNSVGFQAIAIHPRGLRIVAGGNAVGRPNGKMVMWDTNGLKPLAEIDLPSKARRLAYSFDGALVSAMLEDGECQLFDGLTGAFLESIPPTKGLNSIEFSEDGRRLLFALEDGSIQTRSLRSIGVVRASTFPIASLSFSPNGKQLLIADTSGKLSIRSANNLSGQIKELDGAGAKVLQSKFSVDGQSMVAVFDNPEHTVLVWKLDATTGMPAASAPDVVVRSPESRNVCAAFTLDGQYLLLGGEDGMIRAWSLQDSREVARFRGHTSSLIDIAPFMEAGRFVSGDVERSIRTWRFPGNLPKPGDPVPEGALEEGTQMQRVGVPQQVVKEEDDRVAAARQALIKGNPNDQQVGEIFKLLSNDSSTVAEMTASSRRLRGLENDPNASLEDIYRERQRNAQLRNKLDIAGKGRSQVNFASGFVNAVMQVETNFRFNQEEALRPVKICFADRFLFAARPSVPPKPVDPDNPQPVGDNGDLLSWEFRVTQLAAREWSVENVNVQELFPIPESNSVFAAPSMMLFSQNDGISRQFPASSQWGVSRNVLGKKQYFVVGSTGAARVESEILRVYDAAQLTNEKVAPISHYSSYEAGVTALAFSNQSSLIAFAVRERAVHRLFVADLNRFDKSIVMVAEYTHKKPWFANESLEPGVPGITSLAFSLDNRYLVGHGQYDTDLWRFTTWSINPNNDGAITGNREWELDNKEKPFLNELNSRPIRFIKVPQTTSRERSASTNLMVIENDSGFAVLDLNARRVVGSIPYLSMQRGLPQRSLSEDGRWIIMGDDRGNVYVWNVLNGQRYSVAYTNEIVREQNQTKANGKTAAANPPKVVQERPAHAGPVTGVALSSNGKQGDFPEFAASIGEENRLIVWDLIPVLGNKVPTGTVKKQAKK